MRRFGVVVGLLLALAAPWPLAAQEVRLEGKGGRAVALLREILARNDYRLLERDTVLPAGFRAPGDLVIVRAEVRLEGAVAGAVAVVDGALYLRPGAGVGGPIAAIGSDVMRSAAARHGEIVEEPAGTALRVRRNSTAATYTLHATPPPGPPHLALPGLWGVNGLTYDRVNGASARAAAEWRFTGREHGPTAAAWGAYRSARGEVDGGGSLRTILLGVQATAAAERTTISNDVWARGDFSNSLAALGFARDYRDYYRSERASLTLARADTQALVAGERRLVPRLVLLASRDRSLPSRDPWAASGSDDWRANPDIDRGTLVSIAGGAAYGWRGATSRLDVDALLERGLPGPGDFDFTQWTASTAYEALALRGHTLRLQARAMAPIGQEPAPRQRWGILGGSSTLPTFEIGRFRGDHLAFARSDYLIPWPPNRLPLLSSAQWKITHLVGAAWTGDDGPQWEQNLGAGVTALFADVQLFLDPATRDLAVGLGLNLAF